jgi:hypothetical protein
LKEAKLFSARIRMWVLLTITASTCRAARFEKATVTTNCRLPAKMRT